MKANGEFWNIAAQKSEAEIDIFGVVGDWGMWEESNSAADFIRNLREVGRVSRLNINIHSEGGSVWDGMAIYRSIRDHKMAANGEKVVHVASLAASIASVIMLAGDRIEVAPEAQVMIHNPWGITLGGEVEHEAAMARLKQAKQQILQVYQRRTGASAEHLSELMDAETWMLGDEIKAAGFADVVKEDKAMKRIAAGPLKLVGHFKNVPPGLIKRGPAPVNPEIAARLAKLGVK